jgi:hypothetical protein
MRSLSSIALAIVMLGSSAFAQEFPKGVTAADLATNNKLFLELARTGLKWEEPADPVRIAGPIYFVGTTGLGAFLITTSAGHILMNTDAQDVVRMNRDTLYSSGVFDLDAAPLTVTLPDSGRRFMSMQIISQDHYTTDVVYAPGRFTYDRKRWERDTST